MSSTSGALTSRVGRRFVMLFAGSALVPLVLFAALAVLHVSHQAESDLQNQLHRSAKSAGMGLAARLSQVAGDVALVAELGSRDPDALARHVGERCRTIAIRRDGRSTRLLGDGPLAELELTAADREHLAGGRPIARFVGDPAELLVAAAIDPAHPAALVVAQVRGEWFWDPDELRGPRCEFAAYDPQARPLYHTASSPPPVELFAAAMRRAESSSTFRWRIGGEPHVARYWRAFLQPQYRLDLYVVQSLPEAAATAISDMFVRTFWLCAAGTLLLVLLASLVQIRRTLDPIVALRAAAARLGAGELGVRVRLTNDDEFGELGRAFDDMAGRLQENIDRRERTERDLVASRDQALAAVRAKATFLTNVSHELRTPMAEILSAAEILTMLEDGEVEAREEFSGIALAGATRLSGLLDDVLALGDDAPREPSPTDVGAAVRAAVDGLSDGAGARLAADLPDDLPPVLGDRDRLREAFARLLDNAIKFSAPDTPIEVRGRAADGAVVIEVQDHGAGIDPADHARIFEPFCQVGRDQMIDKAGGTGLGLTLAKKTVEAHGGAIEVDSAPGQGSTFRVRLPAADAPQCAREPNAQMQPQDTEPLSVVSEV